MVVAQEGEVVRGKLVVGWRGGPRSPAAVPRQPYPRSGVLLGEKRGKCLPNRMAVLMAMAGFILGFLSSWYGYYFIEDERLKAPLVIVGATTAAISLGFYFG